MNINKIINFTGSRTANRDNYKTKPTTHNIDNTKLSLGSSASKAQQIAHSDNLDDMKTFGVIMGLVTAFFVSIIAYVRSKEKPNTNKRFLDS